MRGPITLLLSVVVLLPTVSRAQTTSIGVAGGLNFVGGGSSKIAVDVGGLPVTGGDRQGGFFAAFLERRTDGSPASMRLELFHGRLTSGPKSGNGLGRAALQDFTYGAAATMAYSLSSGTGIRPYTLLGAGLYATSLGTNAVPGATEVTETRRGIGLGLHLGLGAEWRVSRTRMFAEWRYQQALHETRGSAFMPFIVGLKF
jgi:hypothetical protein